MKKMEKLLSLPFFFSLKFLELGLRGLLKVYKAIAAVVFILFSPEI
jgi:hypothetical protein